jgi:hypothetical protein
VLLLVFMLIGVHAMISGCTNSVDTHHNLDTPVASPPNANGTINESDVVPTVRKLPGSIKNFIGLSEAAARNLANQQNRQYRVGGRDGEAFPLTADSRPSRITVWVRDGLVIDAAIESYDFCFAVVYQSL